MFCRECGSENLDGAKFCRKCGASLSVDRGTHIDNTVCTIPEQDLMGNAGSSNSNIVRIAGFAVVLFILIVGVIYYSSSRSDVIDLDKYVEVKVSGYDGDGDASLYIDWEKLRDDHNIKFTKKGKEQFGSYMTPVDVLEGNISDPVLEESSGLSNGDTVDYTWSIGKGDFSASEDEIKEYIKCELEFKSGSVEISGLDEISTFDAFDDVSVTVHGNPPNNWAEVEYSGDYFSSYDFNVSPEYNLKDGDTITVTLDDSSIKKCISNYGKKPSENSKNFTVSGVNDSTNSQNTGSQSGYLCPYSSERLMTRDEIVSYKNTDYSSYNFPGGRSIVQMLINEIFARHGYNFEDADLANYFYNNSLYSNVVVRHDLDMDGIFKTMSSIEQDNLRLLMEYR